MRNNSPTNREPERPRKCKAGEYRIIGNRAVPIKTRAPILPQEAIMRFVSVKLFASATIISGASSITGTVGVMCAICWSWHSEVAVGACAHSGWCGEEVIGDGLEPSVRVTIFRSQRHTGLKSKEPGRSTMRASVGFISWVKGGN